MIALSRTIHSHLPYLRRFARSLAGSQKSGDAYVASLLEALVADPSIFPTHLSARTGLYRLLLANWNSVPVNGQHSPPDETLKAMLADRRLDAITPRARQAFLLVAMEGFSASEAAIVLDVTAQTFDQLLDDAAHEIALLVTTDVLIIEDEPLIALDLATEVERLGHNVKAVARTRRDAVEAYSRFRPGLILADIHLADGSSGLDAVNEILGDSDEVAVIFITAYPEHVLTGLRPEPTFLIPKPFQHEMVKAVISQALFFDIKARSSDLLRAR